MRTDLALRLWPYVRRFASKTKRCSVCAASEKYSELHCGRCRLCWEYVATEPPADEDRGVELDMVFQAAGGRYDAICMASGGKDSAYVTHRIRQEFPQFRLLNVIVDNGFMSSVATPNAIRLSELTGTDLLIHTSERSTFVTNLRQAFLNLRGRGAAGVIDQADGDTIFDVAVRLAKSLGINKLICGLSHIQVQQILKLDGFSMQQDGCEVVFPLAAWKTSQQAIRRKVISEGLMPAATVSPLVSNSQLVPAMCALDYQNLGYSSFELEMTRSVREGTADYQTWRNIFEFTEFAARSGLLDKPLDAVLFKLGLVRDDLRS